MLRESESRLKELINTRPLGSSGVLDWKEIAYLDFCAWFTEASEKEGFTFSGLPYRFTPGAEIESTDYNFMAIRIRTSICRHNEEYGRASLVDFFISFPEVKGGLSYILPHLERCRAAVDFARSVEELLRGVTILVPPRRVA